MLRGLRQLAECRGVGGSGGAGQSRRAVREGPIAAEARRKGHAGHPVARVRLALDAPAARVCTKYYVISAMRTSVSRASSAYYVTLFTCMRSNFRLVIT